MGAVIDSSAFIAAVRGKSDLDGIDDVVDYGGVYRLCYIRGPEGRLIGLAQQLGQQTTRANPMDRKP